MFNWLFQGSGTKSINQILNVVELVVPRIRNQVNLAYVGTVPSTLLIQCRYNPLNMRQTMSIPRYRHMLSCQKIPFYRHGLFSVDRSLSTWKKPCQYDPIDMVNWNYLGTISILCYRYGFLSVDRILSTLKSLSMAQCRHRLNWPDSWSLEQPIQHHSKFDWLTSFLILKTANWTDAIVNQTTNSTEEAFKQAKSTRTRPIQQHSKFDWLNRIQVPYFGLTPALKNNKNQQSIDAMVNKKQVDWLVGINAWNKLTVKRMARRPKKTSRLIDL